MNCNSNTAPLTSGVKDIIGCNNGCTPKDINVVCRKIVIPYGQEILAIKGENNSNFRTFLIPATSEEGEDLRQKSFSIITKNSSNVSNIIDIEDPEILDNYIKLKWNITQDETLESGVLMVQIQATSENYIWKTFPANFMIADSL